MFPGKKRKKLEGLADFKEVTNKQRAALASLQPYKVKDMSRDGYLTIESDSIMYVIDPAGNIFREYRTRKED